MLARNRQFSVDPEDGDDARKDTKGTQSNILFHPLWFPPIAFKCFEMNRKDYGARTRDLYRDSSGS